MNKIKETLYQCSVDWDKFYQTTAYNDLAEELGTWRAEILRQLQTELTTKFTQSSALATRVLAGNLQTVERLITFISNRAEELRREYAASDEPDSE